MTLPAGRLSPKLADNLGERLIWTEEQFTVSEAIDDAHLRYARRKQLFGRDMEEIAGALVRWLWGDEDELDTALEGNDGE
jgi:hypothetical protein